MRCDDEKTDTYPLNEFILFFYCFKIKQGFSIGNCHYSLLLFIIVYVNQKLYSPFKWIGSEYNKWLMEVVSFIIKFAFICYCRLRLELYHSQKIWSYCYYLQISHRNESRPSILLMLSNANNPKLSKSLQVLIISYPEAIYWSPLSAHRPKNIDSILSKFSFLLLFFLLGNN